MEREQIELTINDVFAGLFAGPARIKVMSALTLFGLGIIAAQLFGPLVAPIYAIAAAFLFGWNFAEQS